MNADTIERDSNNDSLSARADCFSRDVIVVQDDTTTEQRTSRLRAGSVAFLILSLLIKMIPFGFSARAFELDGRMREKMWAELEPFTVIQVRDEPNCSVDLAKIYVCFDEHDRITYIGCRFTHEALTPRETEEGEPDTQPPILTGVAVKVEDKDYMTFTAQDADSYNEDDYHIQGAVFNMSDTSTTAEVFIGQKYGFGDPLHLQLRFYDADGIASNVYPLEIPSPAPVTTAATVPAVETQTTPKTTKPTTTRTKTEKQTTTRAAKTTVEKTTAVKTTREKTTVTGKITEERATVERITTERTTAEKTAKEKTTKLKTTKAPRTTKPKTTGETKSRTAKTPLDLTDSNELLQEVMAEQVKTKNTLYIVVGILLVTAFAVCFRTLKKKDE